MSYYRSTFVSFEEFQRESAYDGEELGKDELELLQDIDEADNFDRGARRGRTWWD